MASATPSAGHTEGAAAQVLPATPNAHPMSSKEPNPNTDYKMHFLKCKEKFDRVTSEQADIKVNVSKASIKQRKLQDEIDFLLDAIAAARSRRKHSSRSQSHSQNASASPYPPTPTEDAQKSASASAAASARPSRLPIQDELSAGPDRADTSAARRTARAPETLPAEPAPSSTSAANKRARPPSDEADESELQERVLESHQTKKARNE